jgi:hypothetical protein
MVSAFPIAHFSGHLLKAFAAFFEFNKILFANSTRRMYLSPSGGRTAALPGG